MEEKKAKKIAFFAELHELDEADDESEDTSGIGLILQHGKTLPRSLPKQYQSQALRSYHSLGRTTSAPLPESSSHAANEVHIFRDSPSPSPVPIIHSALQGQVTVHGRKMPNDKTAPISKKPLSKAPGKRKRGQSLEQIPDSQQIFKGLAFCMVFALVMLPRRILR